MKLPTINQRVPKPRSASSNQNRLPPTHKTVTSSSIISNLEKNLFRKLQQFDEINVKGSVKTRIQKNETSDELQEKSVDIFSGPYFPKPAKPVQTIIINIIKKFHSHIESKREDSEPLSGTRLKPIQKRMKNKEAVQGSQDLFITGAKQDNQKNDESSSSEDELQRVNRRNNEKSEMKRIFDSLTEDPIDDMNNMITSTNQEMKSHYSSLANLKKTVTNMHNQVKDLGFGVSQELMERLEKQYQELNDLYLDVKNQNNSFYAG